jgi:hypothetical protein
LADFLPKKHHHSVPIHSEAKRHIQNYLSIQMPIFNNFMQFLLVLLLAIMAMAMINAETSAEGTGKSSGKK